MRMGAKKPQRQTRYPLKKVEPLDKGHLRRTSFLGLRRLALPFPHPRGQAPCETALLVESVSSPRETMRYLLLGRHTPRDMKFAEFPALTLRG